MSLTSHQRPHHGATNVWLTPPDLLAALGPFDLDPCAAVNQPWKTATAQYTVEDDGLAQDWDGLVWCNPPFGPEAAAWLARCAQHGNAIALVPARTETRWFVQQVWGKADAVLFLHGRPHFHHPDGTRGKANSGAPICLIAYGWRAAVRLGDCSLAGSLVTRWVR
ncbi:DNA N-6-adenine-methyltransferase [Angustibacter sp. McL0619]|uniref:DNA N-6-adenine-methyltransferase n=1 Tax=Angustibacter sp. McL0619 TaxID=3415676 RepID=UPI003CF8C24E